MKYAIWACGYALVHGNDTPDPQYDQQQTKLASVLGRKRFVHLYNNLTLLDNSFDRDRFGLNNGSDQSEGALIIAIPDDCDVRMYCITVIINDRAYRLYDLLRERDIIHRDILLDFRARDLDRYLVEDVSHAIRLSDDIGEDYLLSPGQEIGYMEAGSIMFDGTDRLIFDTHRIPRYVTRDKHNNEQSLRVKIDGVPCNENTMITGCVDSDNGSVWIIHALHDMARYSCKINWKDGSVDLTNLEYFKLKPHVSRVQCIGVNDEKLLLAHDGTLDVYNADTMRIISTIEGVYQIDECEDPVIVPRVMRAKSARK